MRSRVISFGKISSSVRTLSGALRRDRLGAYAAESAFFLILSAIPLVTLTVTAAGFIIPDYVSDYIYRLSSLVPGILGEYIESEFLSFTEYLTPAPLSVSAVAVIWGASRGVRAVRRGVRSVFGEDGGSALESAIWGLVFTVAFMLIIVAVLVFLVFGDSLASLIGSRFPEAAVLLDAAVSLSPVLILFSLTAFFTMTLATFTPPSAGLGRIRDHIPGAAFAASGWTLYSYIFSVFISDFSSMPRIYGSLASIMVLMLWLYMIMYLLLLGAEVNKLIGIGALSMKK